MGMTVRELINALLDKRMNAEVLLRTPDPQRHDVVGVNFHIEEVLPSINNPEILFEDWRDVFDKREVRGDGMNGIDKPIHELHREIKEHNIKWNNFPNIGLCESYYMWYYAENRLYAILDCMTDGIYLIEARNPVEAFKHLMARHDEAMHAGEMVNEEVTE